MSDTTLKDVLEIEGLPAEAEEPLLKVFQSEDPIAEIAASSRVAVWKASDKTLTGPQAEQLIAACKKERPFLQIAVPATPSTGDSDDTTPEQFARQFGVDSGMLNMLLVGQLAGNQDMDLSDFLPIAQIVAGYNPKKRGFYTRLLEAIANRHGGGPIVAINPDGSVNREATVAYIEDLEVYFEPLSDGEMFVYEGGSFELVPVGIDAQAVFDADPLAPDKPLRKEKGTGRIDWAGVSLEVRQVIYYAANATNEIDSNDTGHLRDLRKVIKKGVKVEDLTDDYPQAVARFRKDKRAGDLPSLKVMVTGGGRNAQNAPFRRWDESSSTGSRGRSFEV